MSIIGCKHTNLGPESTYDEVNGNSVRLVTTATCKNCGRKVYLYTGAWRKKAPRDK